jgi:DNA-directed RNA polymerase subunit RPC12/RpoP
LLKLAKKNTAMIDLVNRCAICDTKLTLYPKDFAACPHCQRKVCRQCWSGAWAGKAFSSDSCTHLAENDGLSVTAFVQKDRQVNWDWTRLIFAGLLMVLAVGIVLFLLNLFAF